MPRVHISEYAKGQHPNAAKGGVRVTAAGAPVTAGQSSARTHDAHLGTQVFDSPPYVAPPPPTTCAATRKDGSPCMNFKSLKRGFCLGHLRFQDLGAADGPA